MNRFENKVVVVTGASQGLGLHIAKEFVDQGATVICVARTEDKLNAAVASIGSDKAIAYKMDVSVESNWAELVKFIKENYGEMDILVNNAAIIPGINILDMSFEKFQEVVGINLNGVFLGMKYCHEVLKKGVYSTIVNISSIGGIKAGPSTGNDAGYNASKAAVRNLTKHAAYVFAPDCIRVVSVHPAGINTPMREAILKSKPELVEASKARNPLPPHCAEPAELAKIVAFLCTPEARSIDGSEIITDCGATAI